MTELTRALWLAVAACAAGCAQFHAQESQGGETHFLQTCEDSSECGVLRCICGVCTERCESDDACTTLDEGARCIASAGMCDGQSSAQMCMMNAVADGEGSTPPQSGGCTDEACGDHVQPLVMFVIDTSGSMERLPDCACETPSCEDCLPACDAVQAQRNRWALALEALTGTFEDFGCVPHAREAPFATYDLGFHLPYHEPTGEQRADGVLDVYARRLRFGSATFDGWDTALGYPPLVLVDEFPLELSNGEEGLWSYPPASAGVIPMRSDGTVVGTYRHRSSPRLMRMDTGIRAASATEGRLLVAHEQADAATVAADIQADLLKVRPYGGTPIAASLDDVLWYFENDPAAAMERANPMRERHVVLITDGYPDDDYRAFGCGCAENEPADCGLVLPEEEAKCPYPTPEQAARHLRCGYSDACDAGVVDAVHVLGLAVEDKSVVERLNDIAVAGGDASAIITEAEAQPSLREALDALLGSIAED